MSLQTVLQQALPLTPESFDRFSNLIDPDWIDQALQSTGTASIRHRRLPAARVVWLVIGLALFQRLARHWGVPHQPAATDWLGLRTLAVDGVVWSAPDTAENRAAFGGGRSQHGEGAWPQVRGVCLMDTESHLLLGAEFGSFAIGELSYARADGRNPRSLPDDL
ncbi:MAG: transposase domain-containing protein [Thiobacillaceae bacterium]